MKKQNETIDTQELVVDSLTSTIKELKTLLEGLHTSYLFSQGAFQNHDSENCSYCQAIASAKVMLTIHNAS